MDRQSSMMRAMESENLLAWYDRHRRDLPWRRTRDPYSIWLSEVMLQQTQVETVRPYYHAFLERFPTVESLAEGDLEEVLAMWSGLGYYRRARQLHRAAGEMVERGGFPTTSEGLSELPGIGPYTAAAVASIAFNEVVPVLDGNVERLLCRRLTYGEDPKKAASRRLLLAAARELLDAERPGDSNQALMELGATICRPLSPDCPRCPLSDGCRARAAGDPECYPPSRRRRKIERRRLAVAVVRDGDRILLFRRPEDDELLPGMWELPTVSSDNVSSNNVQEKAGASLSQLSEAFASRYGGRWSLRSTPHEVRHGITYRSLTLRIYEGEVRVDPDLVAEGPEAAWVGEEERDSFPASSMVGKVLEAFNSRER